MCNDRFLEQEKLQRDMKKTASSSSDVPGGSTASGNSNDDTVDASATATSIPTSRIPPAGEETTAAASAATTTRAASAASATAMPPEEGEDLRGITATTTNGTGQSPPAVALGGALESRIRKKSNNSGGDGSAVSGSELAGTDSNRPSTDLRNAEGEQPQQEGLTVEKGAVGGCNGLVPAVPQTEERDSSQPPLKEEKKAATGPTFDVDYDDTSDFDDVDFEIDGLEEVAVAGWL